MTTVGWGVDATISGGLVTSGTTAADVRKVWGALYTPGIVSGCTIHPQADMNYYVDAGVVAVKTGLAEIVMAPVEGTTVTSGPAPATGSRVDLIYAEQRFPASGDSTAQIKIKAFNTLADVVVPPNSVAIRKYQVSAGQTGTNAAVKVGTIDYSIPFGGSLGVLHEWQNKYDGPISIPLLREGYGTFTLPTDRRVRFSHSTVLSAQGANGFDNTKYCEWYYLPNISGPGINGDICIWTTDGLHQAWATYSFETYINLGPGQYTVSIGAGRMVGPGQAVQHYGLDGQGFGRLGAYFLVEDMGPIV